MSRMMARAKRAARKAKTSMLRYQTPRRMNGGQSGNMTAPNIHANPEDASSTHVKSLVRIIRKCLSCP